MNALTPIPAPDTFEFEGQPIRIFRDGKNVTFAAIDLAKCAGYGAVGEMTRLLKPNHKGVQIVHTLGGRQQIATVTEAGLYRILTQRRGSDRTPADIMERIERFQDWVFEDVLPSIRKTGSYSCGPGATWRGRSRGVAGAASFVSASSGSSGRAARSSASRRP